MFLLFNSNKGYICMLPSNILIFSMKQQDIAKWHGR